MCKASSVTCVPLTQESNDEFSVTPVPVALRFWTLWELELGCFRKHFCTHREYSLLLLGAFAYCFLIVDRIENTFGQIGALTGSLFLELILVTSDLGALSGLRGSAMRIVV